MLNFWKKIDPDAIWLAPALILMSIQSNIAGKNYVNQNSELNMIYLSLALLLIGSAVGLLKPIKRRIEKGIIVEADALKYKKAYAMILMTLIVPWVWNGISHIVR